jgi:hypothetical protein
VFWRNKICLDRDKNIGDKNNVSRRGNKEEEDGQRYKKTYKVWEF